jgi:hypothetical protein
MNEQQTTTSKPNFVAVSNLVRNVSHARYNALFKIAQIRDASRSGALDLSTAIGGIEQELSQIESLYDMEPTEIVDPETLSHIITLRDIVSYWKKVDNALARLAEKGSLPPNSQQNLPDLPPQTD